MWGSVLHGYVMPEVNRKNNPETHLGGFGLLVL